ncbi:mRNA splicing protein prp18 [Trapelia coarctata]|nr:mRNA splicing protein prp18 [Trapelia coarctata]
MDFAALMSAEISKARPSLPKALGPSTTTSTPTSSSKKYLKRADLEAQRHQAYLDEQSALETARLAKLSKKRALEEEETARAAARDDKRRRLAEESRLRREEEEDRKERARRKRLGLPDLLPKGGADDDEVKKSLKEGQEDIPDDELLEKIRGRGEPAILFGETHAQRLRRYYILITPKPVLTTGPIPTTLALVPEADMLVPLKPPPPGPERTFLYRQLASYFTLVLTEWTIALSARPDSVSETFQGKQAYQAMEQSRENMRPLFRRFEKGELEDGILEPVVEIVRAAQERRYVDANDGYLRLSIGKAAWPIGVTMVGIHERSAREKLHESDKGAAHIMSDEVTRKFLQSIKRCLSFAQTRWPPEDQLQLMG